MNKSNVVYIELEYYAALKKILSRATIGMNAKDIMLSKISSHRRTNTV